MNTRNGLAELPASPPVRTGSGRSAAAGAARARQAKNMATKCRMSGIPFIWKAQRYHRRKRLCSAHQPAPDLQRVPTTAIQGERSQGSRGDVRSPTMLPAQPPD